MGAMTQRTAKVVATAILGLAALALGAYVAFDIGMLGHVRIK